MTSTSIDFEKEAQKRAAVLPQWLPGSASVFRYQVHESDAASRLYIVDCDAGTCENSPEQVVSLPDQDKDESDIVDIGCDESPSPWSYEVAYMTVVNHTSETLDCNWISNEGQVMLDSGLKLGESRVIQTWVGHRWRIVIRGNTETRYSFQIKDRRASVTVSISDQNTGRIGLDLEWHVDAPVEGEQLFNEAKTGGRNEALLRAHNVWVRRDGQESQLTFDGKLGNGFKSIYPSPDGRYCIGMQFTASANSSIYRIDVAPKDQLLPKLLTNSSYIRAGDASEIKRPRLFDLMAGKEILLDNSLFINPYQLVHICWSQDSQRYRFMYNERGHQHVRILEVHINGKVRALVDESSSTFIDYNQKLYYKILPDTNELLWASERDDYNHLYLYNLEEGSVKNQITAGTWNVRSVLRVDCDKRRIWFECMGLAEDQDPYHLHVASINFDGTELFHLTKGDGSHRVKWGPGRRFLLDTWSRVDSLPQTVVREAATGKEILTLPQNPSDLMLSKSRAPVKRFVAFGRDGKTSIYGIIMFPTNFDAAKKYPIVEFIYTGPQMFISLKSWQSLEDFRHLTDAGFAVVMSDGMGTNWRSKSFHDICHKSSRDGGFPDRMKWIRSAAEVFPWMDLNRVGCYGSSHGGFDAAVAVMDYHELYKAAVAAAGNHDHRFGALQWNEMWMGYPVDKSYETCSNVTHASRLKGALMLVHGGLDDNVDPALTLRLADALIKADKDFDLVYVPSGDHYVYAEPWAVKKRISFFKRHLGGPETTIASSSAEQGV